MPTTPIQPRALLEDLYGMLRADAPDVARANGLTGGGGYENWTIVRFLLHLTRTVAYDYRREFVFGRMRIDIAFNQGDATPATPPTLTEWKCNPNSNSLAAGFHSDIEKFVTVLTDMPVRSVLPLPLVLGVGPVGAGFSGCAAYPLGTDPQLFLYLSSAATWSSKGVLDKTWYSQAPEWATGSPLLGGAVPALG